MAGTSSSSSSSSEGGQFGATPPLLLGANGRRWNRHLLGLALSSLLYSQHLGPGEEGEPRIETATTTDGGGSWWSYMMSRGVVIIMGFAVFKKQMQNKLMFLKHVQKNSHFNTYGLLSFGECPFPQAVKTD